MAHTAISASSRRTARPPARSQLGPPHALQIRSNLFTFFRSQTLARPVCSRGPKRPSLSVPLRYKSEKMFLRVPAAGGGRSGPRAGQGSRTLWPHRNRYPPYLVGEQLAISSLAPVIVRIEMVVDWARFSQIGVPAVSTALNGSQAAAFFRGWAQTRLGCSTIGDRSVTADRSSAANRACSSKQSALAATFMFANAFGFASDLEQRSSV